jgi:hypothetical protein
VLHGHVTVSLRRPDFARNSVREPGLEGRGYGQYVVSVLPPKVAFPHQCFDLRLGDPDIIDEVRILSLASFECPHARCRWVHGGLSGAGILNLP